MDEFAPKQSPAGEHELALLINEQPSSRSLTKKEVLSLLGFTLFLFLFPFSLPALWLFMKNHDVSKRQRNIMLFAVCLSPLLTACWVVPTVYWGVVVYPYRCATPDPTKCLSTSGCYWQFGPADDSECFLGTGKALCSGEHPEACCAAAGIGACHQHPKNCTEESWSVPCKKCDRCTSFQWKGVTCKWEHTPCGPTIGNHCLTQCVPA
eukprot:TRINITY_DN105288_c0_g1_i1.p1 TRINITY_DN105288_c0_g1~~TRINITY_DN105288_c0_g1_i1.p1  ORF type:complete len:208 (-),score=16.91 TRINITY_DN105288_c0_g1_i1:175-798(-)